MFPIPIPDGIYDGEPCLIGENQPEYEPLPAILIDKETGCLVTRWQFTPEELIMVAVNGVLDLKVMTFNRPLQAMLVAIVDPNVRSSE